MALYFFQVIYTYIPSLPHTGDTCTSQLPLSSCLLRWGPLDEHFLYMLHFPQTSNSLLNMHKGLIWGLINARFPSFLATTAIASQLTFHYSGWLLVPLKYSYNYITAYIAKSF